MGLAGRKAKQRIGSDPRNLTWADDAAKFGQQYLTKLGWDPSRGLGASGDGRTSHIKVAQKLNLLGIGAAGAKGMGDETVAWKQNRDYEMLLKRLNEGLEADQEKGGETEKEEEEEEEGTQDADVPKKKRKRDGNVTVDADEEEERKKRKKDKKATKEKKKKKDDDKKAERKLKKVKIVKDEDKDKEVPNKPEPTEASPSTPVIQAPSPRPMAHRARFLRSKQLASRDSSAVAEILGISTSTSNSPGPASLSATPFPASSEDQTPIQETNHDLRTSGTSVGDYFKEKLAARALDRGKSSTPRSSALSASSSTPGPDSTPVRKDVANVPRSADGYETPRAGLGSRASNSLCAGSNGGETPRAGLGVKFGNLMESFTSSEVIPTDHDDLPKNEEPLLSIHPKATEGTCGDSDERASKKKKKREKAEDGNERKEKKKRIKSVPDVANSATPRAAESVTAAAETDRSTEGEMRKEKAERKEKKKEKGKRRRKTEG